MSAQSIEQYIQSVTLLSDQIDKRELAVILREFQKTVTGNIVGDIVEFGCFEGTTSVHLARFAEGTGKTLYLYDSFEGLPPKTSEDESPAGLQFIEGELHASKKKLITHLRQTGVTMPRIKKAWFSTLTAADLPAQVSFAFLDGDYYYSVLDPLHLIEEILSPGAVILVDDYTSEALPGAARAADEWARSRGLRVVPEASLGIIRLPA